MTSCVLRSEDSVRSDAWHSIFLPRRNSVRTSSAQPCGRAGLDPFQRSYSYHVAVYETLAEAADIEYEELLRNLWRQPLGRVRGSLVDAVDAGRRARSLPALTDAQRATLAAVADNQFITANESRVPSRQVILTLWRGGFR